MTIYDKTSISKELTDIILQDWLGKKAKCLSIQRLHGGMINSVLALSFDQSPYKAVIKISGDKSESFQREAYTLDYLKTHSMFPIPAVYLCKNANELIEQSFILMEKLPGVNLGQASMTEIDRQRVDHQLADILIELHSHERDVFGELDGSRTCTNWLEIFEQRIRENFEDTRNRLTQKSLNIIPSLLEEMPRIFEPQGRPTLIHGDIWATNIMVNNENGWVLIGLVDPGSSYADVEDELAYLEVFGTVTKTFFERYCQKNPLRNGYEVRRLYYWLNTMLLHVSVFGDKHYVMRTERIAEEIGRII